MTETTKRKTPTEAELKKDRGLALSASYALATNKVREDHLAEFNAERQRLMTKWGHEWKPAPTEKEKAQAEFERLLSENPEFAELVQANEEEADAAAAAEVEPEGKPAKDPTIGE